MPPSDKLADVNAHQRNNAVWAIAAPLIGDCKMTVSRLMSIAGIALIVFAGFVTPGLAQENAPAAAGLPAFPGAEGHGALAVGGRGGKVIEVTNLDDSGAGSLRSCIDARGPRICVFRVAGTITVNSNMDIAEPYITIAGQTAPGGGITLRSSGNHIESPIRVRTHDVVIRYMRFRPGATGLDNRALTIANTKSPPYNVMIDHNSFSWSGDELVIAWSNTQKISMQWNILAESLPSSDGSAGLKGPNLGSDGGGNYSFHHNLVAHHLQRSPNISASGGPVDVVNNLIFNPGQIGARVLNNAQVNFVGNYIEAGPNSRISSYVKDDGASGFFLSGNVIEGKNIIKSLLPPTSSGRVVVQPFGAPTIATASAEAAYVQVLGGAGATHGLACDGTWFPRRDAADTRVVQSVLTDSRGHTSGNGYISSPADVGGWPQLDPGTPCADADHDGMPDVWELDQGLNPNQDDSAGDLNGNGYTNVEEYLNGSGISPQRLALDITMPPGGGPQTRGAHVTFVPLVNKNSPN